MRGRDGRRNPSRIHAKSLTRDLKKKTDRRRILDGKGEFIRNNYNVFIPYIMSLDVSENNNLYY